MRLKLDENLGASAENRCADAGHDVATVIGQRMPGCTDDDLFIACRREHRALISLDVDLADPLRFDPAVSPGVAVLRVPREPGRGDVLAALDRLLVELDRADITGRLWVVRADRVRQYEP